MARLKPRPFTYNGYEFTPVRRFKRNVTFRYLARGISLDGVFMSTAMGNWDHEGFYEVAPSYDLFSVSGMAGLWIPGDRYLYAWEGR